MSPQRLIIVLIQDTWGDPVYDQLQREHPISDRANSLDDHHSSAPDTRTCAGEDFKIWNVDWASWWGGREDHKTVTLGDVKNADGKGQSEVDRRNLNLMR